ncbi:L-rhamnose-binding lectin CSL3-like [Glandiceps talaboti]
MISIYALLTLVYIINYQGQAYADPNIYHRVHCEGHVMNLQCPSGVIQVTDANYGRLNSKTCQHSQMYDTWCKADNSLAVVQEICNGVSSCRVNVNNGVFGDPCVHTYKYLEVRYRCVSMVYSTETLICEHGTANLNCGTNEIHINSASYGRSDHSTCPGPIRDTTCHARRSLTTVRDKCEGQQSCQIAATNSVFGDPCYGTFKYLKINYSCGSNTVIPE